jgi:diguanylate cyclase (GGDEF)-like protein/PAS domain S-box-containing protein
MSNCSRHRYGLRALVRALAVCLLPIACNVFAAFTPPTELIVVTDDNYPPYLFRAEDGQLQGILKDKWALWSAKTGVPVRVEGMVWIKAQESVQKKKADVIEALSYTEARASLYEFSPPYAPIEARVFFHRSISGIKDVSTLRGFTLGAKEGSACANWLTERGIKSIHAYPSSESLVQAAGAGEVRLFCMDDPTAKYLLFKHNLADNFRETSPLYTTHFHWAVVKGRTELLDFVQRGFEQIPASDLDDINARWLGNPLKLPVDSRYLYYLSVLVIAIIAAVILLMLWNGALRLRVGAKTTELRNALASLQAHADKVQDLYNNAPCGYHSVDADGVFVEINDTELKWLGYSREEVINKLRITDFLDENGQRRFRRDFHEFNKKDSMRDLEYELVRKDASKLSVLISATTVLDPRGNFVMSRSTVYDITERKHAELALRATLDQTPNVAVQWFDADGRIKYWNNASTSIIGWDAEEVMGKTLDEVGIYTTPQAQELIAALRLIDRDGGAIGPTESTVFRKDGTQGIIMSTLFSIPSLSGEKLYACMDLDVTEHRRSEQRLLATLDNTPGVAVQWFDREGRVLYWNPASEMLYGISSTDAVGHRMDELIHTPEQYREFVDLLGEIERSGKPCGPGEIVIRSRHGVEVTVIYTMFTIPGERAEPIFVCMDVDITELKASERELEQLGTILKRVTETVPLCLSYLDADHRYVWTNARNGERLGHPPEWIIGRTSREVYAERFFADIDQARPLLRDGQSVRTEREWRDASGRTRIYDRILVPDMGSDGKYRGHTSMWLDITERTEADRERERLNVVLKRVTDAIPVCLSYLNAENRYVWTNTRNSERLGLTPEQITGKTVREIYSVHPNQIKGELDTMIRAGKPMHSEREWLLPNGELRTYEFFLMPDIELDGTYRGCTALWLDITERTKADREREQLNVILKRVTDTMPVCLSYLDVDGRYIWTNTRNSERLGLTPEQMIGKTVHEVYGESPGDLKGVLNTAVRERKQRHDEREWRHPNGESRTYDFFVVPDFDPIGVHRGTTSLWLDITERKESEKKISRLNRVYAVLSNINAALIRIKNKQELFDEACRIAVEHGQFGVVWVGVLEPVTQYVNLVAWAGNDADELREFQSSARRDVLSTTGTLVPAIREKRPVFDNDMASTSPKEGTRRWRAVQMGYRSVIVLPLLVEGEVAGILAMLAKEANFFTDEEVKLLTELSGDVAFAMEVIEKEKQINYLAYYDPLTNLPNRSLLQERLEHQMHVASQNGTKLALLMADLRRFRFINQSLGRQAGDTVLRELSVRLKNAWSDPDSVGRVAGDRFAAVLAEVRSETELVHLVEKSIIDSLKSPFRVEGHELVISMTAGIAIYPDDGTNADMLIQNTEAALKQAKASGDRYLFYQPRMNARVAETLRLENKMRRALAKEEFVLHYQPKVELVHGRIIGFEALIRWNDPEVGMVPPGQFIPILEETGMILEAGRWAIRRVLRDYCAWDSSGLQPPRIAVNVSAIQLRSKDFVDMVRTVMNEFTPGCHGLDLEITESLLMEDIEGSTEKLRLIRDMGINIAIDDFGTGYSSLAYLTKLPVNALKIDRSFIDDMMRNLDSMNIVSTIISLAHSLALKVIAEGVESEEQARALRSLNCDEIQGYLVSRPIPAEAVGELLRTREGAAVNITEAAGDSRAATQST